MVGEGTMMARFGLPFLSIMLLSLSQLKLAASSTIVRANYTIGVIMVDPTYTGDLLARDVQFHHGLDLFKEQLDALGGIDVDIGTAQAVDLQYEVIYVMPNTNQTLIAAEAFASNPNIDALTCSPNAGVSTCASVAANASMIFLTSYATDEMCSAPLDSWGNAFDYTYCLTISSSSFADGIFNEASRMGYTKTAIYWAGYYTEITAVMDGVPESAVDDYGLDVVYNKSFDSFAATTSTDGTVVYNEDIVQMLTEARDAEVELLIILVSFDSLYVLEILQMLAYTPPLLMMPVVAGTDAWLTLAGDAGEYVMGVLSWHYKMTYSDPYFGDTETYSSLYLAAYGSHPNQYGAAGSLVGEAVALAIVKGGGITRDKVNRGLGFINSDTFSGLVKFGQFNRNIGHDALTVQWLNDEMVFVLPSSVATGSLYYPMIPWACRDKREDIVCFDGVMGVSNTSQAGLTAISLIAIAILIVALIGVFRKQTSVIFNRASPLFCKLLIVFGIGGYISCILFAIMPTQGNGDVLCPARIWVLAYSATGVLASLFAKTWRLYKLFTMQKAIKRQVITDQQLLGVMAAILSGTTVLMIGWTADPNNRPHFEIVPEASNSDMGVATCAVDSPWLWVNIAYFLLLNAWGAFLAYHVRKLPSSFNESKYIFFSLYNIFICIVVLLPIGAVLLKDTVNEDVTLCIGILFAFSSVMISIIGSKFMLDHYQKHEKEFKNMLRSSESTTAERTERRGTSHQSHMSVAASTTPNNNGGHGLMSSSESSPTKEGTMTRPLTIVKEQPREEEDEEADEETRRPTVHYDDDIDVVYEHGPHGDGSGGHGAESVRLELAKVQEKWGVALQSESTLKQQNEELQAKLAAFEKQRESETAALLQRTRELEEQVAEYERIIQQGQQQGAEVITSV